MWDRKVCTRRLSLVNARGMIKGRRGIRRKRKRQVSLDPSVGPEKPDAQVDGK